MIDALTLLLGRYSGAFRSRGRRAADRTRVLRSIEYMEDNLSRALSLREIASASGYSRFHFLRLFKRVVGQTPHAFLMGRRVVRAQGLLRQGRSLADVAYQTGFADQAHLNRRFKQIAGVTPGEFSSGCRRTPRS